MDDISNHLCKILGVFMPETSADIAADGSESFIISLEGTFNRILNIQTGRTSSETPDTTLGTVLFKDLYRLCSSR